MNVVRMKFLTLLLFSVVLADSSHADNVTISTATQLYSLGASIGAYVPEAKTLHIGRLKDGVFEESNSIQTKGQVYGVIATSEGVLVATGMGRGDLQAPVRVTLYNQEAREGRVVFEKWSERSQVSFFKEHNDAIWITFFDSKFFTKTGYFTKAKGLPWGFNEVASERLGDAVEVLNDGVLIGRPYGEVQGQDGDAMIIRGEEKILLPSYRGVRAVAALGEGKQPTLIIADGWHQNYGQLGQARLSVLSWNTRSERYALELIEKDVSQYNFNKLLPITIKGIEYVAALGNKSFSVFGIGKNQFKKLLYSRASEEYFFDVALYEQSNDHVSFALLDRGLHVVTFTP